MTECEHTDCTQDSIGTIVWDTKQNPEYAYCKEHLQGAKVTYPEFVKEVKIV